VGVSGEDAVVVGIAGERTVGVIMPSVDDGDNAARSSSFSFSAVLIARMGRESTEDDFNANS